MKTGIIFLIAILLLTVYIMSCNLEVNTSDPQASSDIIISKQNGLFVAEYICSSPPTNIFNTSESWVESVWFNKIKNGKVIKEKSEGFQLNLKLNLSSNPEFAGDKYLSNWEMKDDQNNVVGSGSGVYILLLKNGIIPDTFHISIFKTEGNISTNKVADFTLFRKK